MQRHVYLRVVMAGGTAIALVIGLIWMAGEWRVAQQKSALREARSEKPRQHITDNIMLWWDALPDSVRRATVPTSLEESNIRREHYAGAESCRRCHQENYDSWSEHPHRWMNAVADEQTVRGNFDNATISYLGGTVTFYREGDGYRMRLERGDIRRVYQIEQTIGSRFFQYYVGRQTEGPEPPDHPFCQLEHVLPLGYWLDREEWVPTVHINREPTHEDRPDIYEGITENDEDFAHYSSKCNYCHTTFVMGDQLIRHGYTMGRFAPRTLHFHWSEYLANERPAMLTGLEDIRDVSDNGLMILFSRLERLDAGTHGVNLGISCEACHLGAKEHAEGRKKKPDFFPKDPLLLIDSSDGPPHSLLSEKTRESINWACGRCHTGNRPAYAAGMSTWNSVEYSDAMLGSCYTQLTCIDCHDPHTKTGPVWTKTPEQDDASCLKCHQKYEPEAARVAHTHHPMGSEGSRCMNCHMPRINEGLQDVVRTHMIYSPTRPDMIEENHPNACNLCHTDKPIDWTLGHLGRWYGTHYDPGQIAANHHAGEPVGLGWLKSENEAVRLVAADALTRTNSEWALPELIGALDDPYLLNRQFARIGIERMCGIRLADHGYQFYMTAEERREPLEALRKALLGDAPQPTAPAAEATGARD